MSTIYASVHEGDNFFEEELGGEAWASSTKSQQQKALNKAARLINRLRFSGYKTDGDQDEEFPRNGEAEVPSDIMVATILVADRLLDGIDTDEEFENLQLTGATFSQISSTYNRKIIPPHIAAGIPSSDAWRLLLPYLKVSTTIPLCRV